MRDALSADPAVIAAMPEEARQRLATRLEAARTNDGADDAADSVSAGDPRALVAQADAARIRRGAEALIVGDISAGAARALAVGLDVPSGPATLPGFETESAGAAITPLESRALQGAAGSLLRGLLAASGAHRLRRVVGWPIGAVAVGDTAYVGGAWLAALAPASADGGADAGAAASATTRSPTPTPTPTGGSFPTAEAVAATSGALDGGVRAPAAVENDTAPGSWTADGGVVIIQPGVPTPTPSDSTSDSCGATADSCAACADATSSSNDSCNSTDDGSSGDCSSTADDGTSNDSCNSTDDGSSGDCSSTADDGTSNDCSNTTSDGSDGSTNTSCQVSLSGRRRGGTSHSMMLTLFGPLAFLFTRRGR